MIGNLKSGFLNKTENHFSLYKLNLNLNNLTKNQMTIEHQLVLSNLNINVEKFYAAIDYDVSLFK